MPPLSRQTRHPISRMQAPAGRSTCSATSPPGSEGRTAEIEQWDEKENPPLKLADAWRTYFRSVHPQQPARADG